MTDTMEPLEPRLLFSTANRLIETDLVSNNGGTPHAQINLINAWGITTRSNGTVWVASEIGNDVFAYDDKGNRVQSPVQVSGPPVALGLVTGVIPSTSSEFIVHDEDHSEPAELLIATRQGTISAFNHLVDGNHAIRVIDESHTDASFTGLALSHRDGKRDLLYVANFGNGRIDVFNGRYKQVTLRHDFADPDLPDTFSPFNVTRIGNKLYVAFAQKASGSSDEVTGRGLGAIDVFTLGGKLIKRLVNDGEKLNAPWAMVKAPDDFAGFGGDLLVGNFGSGKIDVYDRSTGERVGVLRDNDGNQIAIDGLWGLGFGNRHTSDAGTLFFAAGPDDGANGLFGKLELA
jgi:uncharacterized protein (TIGR03118 family)